jgi:hypothetical protein
MNLFELAVAIVLSAGYSVVTLTLAMGIAHLLGVSLAVVAFPLAIAPILVVFRREWRQWWLPVLPVATAVLIVVRSEPTPTWDGVVHNGTGWLLLTAAAGCGAFCMWGVLLWFGGMIMGWDQRGKQPPVQS